ncbi:ribosome biogenesis GTP-binding protein YihA/YsxC [Ligilactobacillus hohenheimensis]|uniref:ribosome biogenesis GTP-binding protein YihA/YsxC n=1 Tax=Ligilactobacillus hohenheimensis TaxID=2991832 RepID=UPI0024BA6976|nr:ribosome biogenesis GTP-binding protein YihA/YsxC [Ligilactobacillus hohenheimensis]
MEVHNVELTISAVRPEQYPQGNLPEIALAGRSNVGKSSLINTLINRKKLARTSSQPGKTQTLNFYNVEHQLNFVDVPGYGYARASRQDREKWGAMIEEYFAQRQQLAGVISLVDSRHAPTELDQQMIDFIHYYQFPLLVVGTKIDKIPRSRRNQSESVIRKTLQLTADDQLVLFSAVDRTGKDDVWRWIEQQCNLTTNGGK